MLLARQVKLNFQGNDVIATELKFTTAYEEWNEYKCEDGSIVRMKTVVAKIYRTDRKNTQTGEPVYVVRSSNIVDVVAGEGEGEVH